MRYRNFCYSLTHSRRAIYVCLHPIVHNELLGGRASPGCRSSRKNHGKAKNTVIHLHELHTRAHEINSHHSASENAIKTLNDFVLLAVLEPAFSPSRISPREETVKEMFETRLRDRDSNVACSSQLHSSVH
jgi:hypothetical protein